MSNQLVIQILLIGVFLVFAVILLLPGRGARRLALRRIVLLFAFLAAIAAVAFPGLVNDLANAVGVGRGTDLVLYALVVVFIGNSIASSVQDRARHREITRLARALALQNAERPDPAPKARKRSS